MKRAELQTHFLQELATHLNQFGFDPKLRVQSFYKKVPGGRQAFHVSFIPHANDIDVTTDVAIRIDALEDLLNAWRSDLKKGQSVNTFTVGAELGNIAEGGQKRFHLDSEAAVADVVSAVMDYFKRVAVPFFERLSDPERVFECLSKNDRIAWLYSPFHADRWKAVLGLAFLLRKTDRIDALCEQGESFLSSRRDPELRAFREFAEEIKKRSKMGDAIA